MSEELTMTLMQAGRLAATLLNQMSATESTPGNGQADHMLLTDQNAMLEQQLTLLEQHRVLEEARTRALLAPEVLAELKNRAAMRTLPDPTVVMQLATTVLEGNKHASTLQASVLLN